ncbi:MAG: formate--tetrahydrofolate ligase, partial [Yoonia sp.]
MHQDTAAKSVSEQEWHSPTIREVFMEYKSDIEIARAASKRPIQEIGAKLGIESDDLLPYGHDKAKVSQRLIDSVQDRP